MPTYEYRCPEGHEFEHFYRKMSDAVAELPCPECGKNAVRQLSGGAGLVFKGSGFYLTDYGKNAHRKGGSNAGDGSSKGEAKGDAKSESGAAAKPEKSETKSETKSSSESKSGDAKPSSAPSTSSSPKTDK